jgi:ParB family chromosome partitioning protein
LGRGLDALLPTRGDEGLEGRSGLLRAPLDSIDPNPRQPRESFEEESLDELAASIKELGVLQPLLVREKAGGFELIAGERRLRAARRAGLTEVPVMVVEADDRGSLERALVENIHRADLNPIEEAAAYRELIDDGGLTQDALAERLGRNRVTITNSLRLLTLPTSVQALLIDGRLSSGHGKALLGLEGGPFQDRLARRVATEGLSVRETEELVRKYQTMTGAQRSGGGERSRPPELLEAQKRLADHLQTRVRIDVGKRKGKIVVDFVSLEELDRLVDVLMGERAGSSATIVSPQ